MKLHFRGSDRRAALWGAVAVFVFLVTAFSVSIPEARAQSATRPADDAKRYSQLLQSIYQFLMANYVDEPDPRVLYEGAMKGMLDSLDDPHSVFLDETMLSDMMEETEGSYAGVGLYISKQTGSVEENGPRYIEAVSPIEGSPAWKIGIRPGDLIIAIDGDDTSDMTVDEASAKIRGAEGTSVTLRFRRGSNYEFDQEFVRATIEIPAVKYDLIESRGVKVGYVRIIEWIPQTADRIKEALTDLKARGADRLLIDVRSNPGGLLGSVVDVSDLFLDSGMIVSTRGRDPRDDELYEADSALSWPKDSRMIVLVNRGSASASEIFAGAMKDTKRALLLGEKTYGKGSVQQVFPLDTTGFKLTLARYYTPSGVNIDKKGIEPDIEVKDIEFTDDMLKTYERLLDSGKIESWAKAHPEANVQERNAFAASLLASGFTLPESYARMLVRDELERTKDVPVYDAEFDTQLDKALELLAGTDFELILAGTKTLGEKASASASAIAAAAGTAEAGGKGNGDTATP